MTTTGIYQGLQGDRSSSRVLGPPGGASSDIFGTGPVAARPQPKATRDNDIFGGPAVPEATPPTKKADIPVAKPVSVAAEDSPSKQKPAPAVIPVRNPITGMIMSGTGDVREDQVPDKAKYIATFNPITGEEIIGKGAAAPHTSTRVAHPPGGHQTKLW